MPTVAHHTLLMGCNSCLDEVLLVRSSSPSTSLVPERVAAASDICAFLCQGICTLMTKLEARSSVGDSGHKQLMEASGAVLIDMEMTIKLMTQGKVRCR